METGIGEVVEVGGSKITIALEGARTGAGVNVGTLLKIRVPGGDLIVSVGRESTHNGTSRINADVLGEITSHDGGERRFTRGVTDYPALGEKALPASTQELGIVFAAPGSDAIGIGTLAGRPEQHASLLAGPLLTKHFAVLGSTGSGKSCTVAVLLSAIVDACPNAHVVLLDPHNEYAHAFADRAELLNVQTLKLPFWLLNFEEAVRIVIPPGREHEEETEKMILQEAIVRARRLQAEYLEGTVTVDTPLPYRVTQLLRHIDEAAGRLNNPAGALPYMRLRARLEALRADRRMAFMFGDSFETKDEFSEILGRILRIPVHGKPIAILDLSGVPSDVVDVIVSLLARMILDFAIWARRENKPPILLLCEEAHRYVPADTSNGFEATHAAITRIAKEGRKYGVALGLISQRPSEISPVALSQCGTVFVMRLGNENDQAFVARTLPYAALEMLKELPSLPTQESIVTGEAAPVTMRVRLNDLPEDRRPRSDAPDFWKSWQSDVVGEEFRNDAVYRWRIQERRQQPRAG